MNINTDEFFNRLINNCKNNFEQKYIEDLTLAYEHARQLTGDKTRLSGEPYLLHPVRVARIAFEEVKLGAASVIAAVLHDLVHDGYLSKEEVEKKYGKESATIISGLIKISSLYTEKLSLNSENFIILLLTITDDVRIILLKLADRLDNIRQIKNFDEDKQLKIAQETRLLYAPIAHRLGLYYIKSEFEDISLRHIHPDAYFSIARKLKDTKNAREKYIDVFSEPIKKMLIDKGLKFEIKGRPKSVNSIYGKITKKKIDISEIFDLFAIRIILDEVPYEKEKEICWFVYSLITNQYTPSPERLRDWISTPRPSGYESLHTTVLGPQENWVEVQIRTKRMDEIAEKGNAAHWKYKESGTGQSHDDWLRQIRDVLENNSPDAIEKLKASNKQKPKDIFIFTPQGDIKKLREGATVLDFAYSIHSNIGNTCTGARVNSKIVPIKQKLNNGDTVEIITSKNQRPRTEWLNIVVSSKAKTRIRRTINEYEFKEAEIGKELLHRKLSNLKIDFNDAINMKLIHHFKYKLALDFYQDIAQDKIDIQKIKDYLLNPEKENENTTANNFDASTANYVQKKQDNDNFLIIDQDLVNVDYKLAKCCHPIPGDDIFGFVTIQRGIQIHRRRCPNAKNMLENYPYRVIPARWTAKVKESAFQVEIVVTGIDRMGVMNHITEVISKDHMINMRSVSIETKDGIFKGFISVFIKNLEHLDTLLANLSKIKGVLKAERLDKTKKW